MTGAIKTIQTGFTDQTYARGLCGQLARGLANPYWLVRDASGRFHPLRAPRSPELREGVIKAIGYLGVDILDEYDITGALVKK